MAADPAEDLETIFFFFEILNRINESMNEGTNFICTMCMVRNDRFSYKKGEILSLPLILFMKSA